MLTEEWLRSIESEMVSGENVDHCDIRDLVEEVRRLRKELAAERAKKPLDVTILENENKALWDLAKQRLNLLVKMEQERDAARKAAKVWKAATKWYRSAWNDLNVVHGGALSTVHEQAKDVSRMAKQVYALRQQARAWKQKALGYRTALNFPVNGREYWEKEANSWCDAYWKVFDGHAHLQNAINRYCETRNWCGFEDHTPYGKAIDDLYRISRESGFRPRYVADSQPEGSR